MKAIPVRDGAEAGAAKRRGAAGQHCRQCPASHIDAAEHAPLRKPAPGNSHEACLMRGRNSKGNVFVGNLPPDFPDERLAETFDPYGIVLSASVARDPDTGARLRYGFVDIATEKAATQAITALDGTEIDGCKLNVKARERAKKAPAGARPRRPAPRGARPNGASHPAAASPRAMPAP